VPPSPSDGQINKNAAVFRRNPFSILTIPYVNIMRTTHHT
jgi:hypothetical protein